MVGLGFYFRSIMTVEMKVFPTIEKEALALALEARDFLCRSRGKDLGDIQLRFRVCERIEWVLAWVLYQKAILAGETTWSAVREELAGMAGRPLAPDTGTDEATDPQLRALAERSAALFGRVHRLLGAVPAAAGDGPGIGRAFPATAPSSHARSLSLRHLH